MPKEEKKENVAETHEPELPSIVCTCPIEDCVAIEEGDCSRCPLF